MTKFVRFTTQKGAIVCLNAAYVSHIECVPSEASIDPSAEDDFRVYLALPDGEVLSYSITEDEAARVLDVVEKF